jgi:(4S)-4-hydroxy-5-phosphonooxypentane-2,3-dione isomerase
LLLDCIGHQPQQTSRPDAEAERSTTIAMLIVIVQIHVKPECIEAFREATIANARGSAHEPGIARFDFLQRQDDPNRFVLIEVYRDADAPARHKETAHYAAWRAAADSMMAEMRTSVRFTNVYPDDGGW